MYLLVVVQRIVIIGLSELFVGDLDVRSWLETRSLDQPLSVGAVAALILTITAFRAFSGRK